MMQKTWDFPLWTRLKRRIEITSAGCWLWQGGIDDSGYGLLDIRHKKYRTHRFIFEASGKSIPSGLSLDHLCGQKHCCNPAHLEPVTHAENMRRLIGKVDFGLFQRSKTHCPVGHPYSPENTYLRKRGSRDCIICKRLGSRRWIQRNRIAYNQRRREKA